MGGYLKIEISEDFNENQKKKKKQKETPVFHWYMPSFVGSEGEKWRFREQSIILSVLINVALVFLIKAVVAYVSNCILIYHYLQTYCFIL